jgi:hypothetical protein
LPHVVPAVIRHGTNMALVCFAAIADPRTGSNARSSSA